jgi:hypothetical protein
MHQQNHPPIHQPAQFPYTNGQYGSSPQSNTQYGPQQGYFNGGQQQFNHSYGNPAQAIPQGHQIPQGPTPYPIYQHAQPLNHQQVQPAVYQQAQPPYVNGQYGAVPQNNHQHGQHQGYYGGPQQFNPPYINSAQSMPQQVAHSPVPYQVQQQVQPPYVNGQYGAGPQGHPQHGSQQAYYSDPQQFNQPYGQGQQGPPSSFNNPVGPQVAFNSPVQTGHPRQDSGYGSARGSYSGHDTEMTGMQLSGIPNHAQSQPQAQQQNSSGNVISPVDANNQSDQTPKEGSLSPISMELLGKTSIPPVTAVNGRKPEPMRQPDDGGTAVRRKPKNPQPVVAAAYRYAR